MTRLGIHLVKVEPGKETTQFHSLTESNWDDIQPTPQIPLSPNLEPER
ncbi:MAG: hypothetical protein HC840_10555 [Leptolyngbyaceae cyanobacterium RM2_2_4]|nr:hypothetical protein [Leptolyngbyaceae cyanobacterium SM1_4_3]NJO49807.1 hypothetical protein [Leptolyngbyaceae cyanobacterium RM2_2_4]NJO73657.1 hypothetical protein [Leptolyngbyaceae cyanobacterium RM1_406_9]